MDKKTQDAYNRDAAEIAKLHGKLSPTRLYELATTFFIKDELTLDLGCGTGRDTNWLTQNGHPTDGCDFSEELLKIAREQLPGISFYEDSLPDLKATKDQSYQNVFISAVLQHIPRSHLIESIRNILRITRPDGKIILSFRSTASEDNRESDKLYENYQSGQIASIFESFGANVILEEKKIEEGRNLCWSTIVIDKHSPEKKSGIERIQDIIQRDSKTSTYKFALIRALCEISRYEPHLAHWSRENDLVFVPIKRIAIRWLGYYFPLIKNNIKQTTSANLKFEKDLSELAYGKADLFFFLKDLETNMALKKLVNKVSETIIRGPIAYSGGGSSPHFKLMSKTDCLLYPEFLESDNGMIAIPISMWRDINLYSHWIEDSLTLQWVYMSKELNKTLTDTTHFFELHSENYLEPKRDTYDIRKLYKDKTPECIWSGRALSSFAVDHMIPWSVWRNNDLWNLLPSDPKINLKKSNQLPSPALISKSFDRIKSHWDIYGTEFEDLFNNQLRYSLGIDAHEALTNIGKNALIHSIERIQVRTGREYFG